MRIVLWIGNGANQKALANKLNSIYPIQLIIIESRKRKTQFSLRRLFEKILDKLLFRSIYSAWNNLTITYNRKFPNYPNSKLLNVPSINTMDVYQNTIETQPDLIIVSGTSLIKDKLLEIKPKIGIINLHTGLSPYIKGGPNCTNWCISTNQFQYIGNTIMWLNKGIDTGNIIASELTNFTGNETLKEIHFKVMEHAHDLYIRVIQKIAYEKIPGIIQDNIAMGITYYTKQWGIKQKFTLLLNLKEFKATVQSNEYKKEQLAIKTIDLNK